jgi:hypothetical protein
MANTKIPAELSSTPSISDSGDATAITISSSENVGLAARLSVGTTTVGGGNTKIVATGGTDNYLQLVSNTGTGGVSLGNAGSVFLLYNHTGALGSESFTERLRIDSSGNIGFNTAGTDAGSTSDAQNSTATPNRIVLNNDYSSGYTDASLKLYLFNSGATRQGFTSGPAYDLQYHSSGDATGRHAFYTANTERFRITGNNVFLTGGTDARIQLGSGGAGAAQVDNNTVHIRGDGATMKLMAASGGSYLYEVNGTEVMRIESTGKTTLAGGLGYVADDNAGILQLRVNSSAGGWAISARSAVTTSTGFWFVGKQSNGTNVFTLTSDSDSIDLNFLSDERMKMNITDSADVLDKVKQITVKDFDWRTELNGDTKDDSRPTKEYGFIAQNFQDIGLGQYVKELMPTDESDDTLGMDYGNITPILVKAIQEQQTIIEDLKARIETLEG